MNRHKHLLSVVLSLWIAVATSVGELAHATDDSTSPVPVVSAQPSANEIQQLVAPIALYPDSLVAQILAASSYPDQVVEADRWVQAHPELKGDQLAQAVDQESWDPSVKALTEFPSVLANMDKNLSWTSSLGEAYINNEQAVLNAVQAMRKSAKKAGNLKSTSQLTVSNEGQTIVIEPANPGVVYVPEYNPWIVYADPIVPWPGWYWYPGLYWRSPGMAFGVGFGIGFFGGFGWGWHHWAPDWHSNTIVFNHSTYISHSRTLIHHDYYRDRARTNGFRGGPDYFRGRNALHAGSDRIDDGQAFHRGPAHVPQRGFTPPRTPSFGRSGAFGGFNHGGVVRGYSARGFSSMGGFHGGGSHGGSHGRR